MFLKVAHFVSQYQEQLQELSRILIFATILIKGNYNGGNIRDYQFWLLRGSQFEAKDNGWSYQAITRAAPK